MVVLNVGVQITTSKALFSRIFEYLDLPVTLTEPERPTPIPSGGGHLEIDTVSFTYPGAHRPALANISIDVPAGSTLAIVGATGSGKSTLANLISRLADPDSGALRIDGVDLRDLTFEDVAELVGVVSQDTYLLHASIAENLRYARPEASDGELVEAARAAQINEHNAALPVGFDSGVWVRGSRFSGGYQLSSNRRRVGTVLL